MAVKEYILKALYYEWPYFIEIYFPFPHLCLLAAMMNISRFGFLYIILPINVSKGCVSSQ